MHCVLLSPGLLQTSTQCFSFTMFSKAIVTLGQLPEFVNFISHSLSQTSFNKIFVAFLSQALVTAAFLGHPPTAFFSLLHSSEYVSPICTCFTASQTLLFSDITFSKVPNSPYQNSL